MRRDALYLRDIIEAAKAIQQFVADCTRETLAANDLVRSAILHKLTIIGEAALTFLPNSGRSTPRSNGPTSSRSATSSFTPISPWIGASCR